TPCLIIAASHVLRPISAMYSTPFRSISLHDALPILPVSQPGAYTAVSPGRSSARTCSAWAPTTTCTRAQPPAASTSQPRRTRLRSEEHTSELQSRFDLV